MSKNSKENKINRELKTLHETFGYEIPLFKSFEEKERYTEQCWLMEIAKYNHLNRKKL